MCNSKSEEITTEIFDTFRNYCYEKISPLGFKDRGYPDFKVSDGEKTFYLETKSFNSKTGNIGSLNQFQIWRINELLKENQKVVVFLIEPEKRKFGYCFLKIEDYPFDSKIRYDCLLGYSKQSSMQIIDNTNLMRFDYRLYRYIYDNIILED